VEILKLSVTTVTGDILIVTMIMNTVNIYKYILDYKCCDLIGHMFRLLEV